MSIYVTPDRTYGVVWDNEVSIIGFKIGASDCIIYDFTRGYTVSRIIQAPDIVFKDDAVLCDSILIGRREVKVPDISTLLKLVWARYEIFTDLSHLNVPVKYYKKSMWLGSSTKVSCTYNEDFGVHSEFKILTNSNLFRALIYYNHIVVYEVNGIIVQLPEGGFMVSSHCRIKENFENYIIGIVGFVAGLKSLHLTASMCGSSFDLVELHKKSIMFPKMTRVGHYMDITFN
jgi:hypothetical protein